MSRRRYLIAYDIAEASRLHRTCSVMEGHGTRLQYSVFLCDLSRAELVVLERHLLRIIDPTEDSVIRIDLGPTGACAVVKHLGQPRVLPHTGPQII